MQSAAVEHGKRPILIRVDVAANVELPIMGAKEGCLRPIPTELKVFGAHYIDTVDLLMRCQKKMRNRPPCRALGITRDGVRHHIRMVPGRPASRCEVTEQPDLVEARPRRRGAILEAGGGAKSRDDTGVEREMSE